MHTYKHTQTHTQTHTTCLLQCLFLGCPYHSLICPPAHSSLSFLPSSLLPPSLSLSPFSPSSSLSWLISMVMSPTLSLTPAVSANARSTPKRAARALSVLSW